MDGGEWTTHIDLRKFGLIEDQRPLYAVFLFLFKLSILEFSTRRAVAFDQILNLRKQGLSQARMATMSCEPVHWVSEPFPPRMLK